MLGSTSAQFAQSGIMSAQACSGLLKVAHDQNHGAQAAHDRNHACLRLLMLDPLLVPRADSGLILVPQPPCSFHPNISNSRRMYTMILFREVWPKHVANSLLPSLTLHTVVCFSSYRKVPAYYRRSRIRCQSRHISAQLLHISVAVSVQRLVEYFSRQCTSIPLT